ncbi:hypothetical protein EH164_20820 [Kosakonia sp. CCTCC M2018092]|nr:hypothetical protein EH164_20820 [Kosakonia sp. CCTCC M2018092]
MISVTEIFVMCRSAHKNAPFFAKPVTKLPAARSSGGQSSASHPPISSPIKNAGGGGFAGKIVTP